MPDLYCTALRRRLNTNLNDQLSWEYIRIYCQWLVQSGAPIVLVFKGDGSICICGNYKQVVNKAANCDKYPIPKTEDIFATLDGRGLDLSQSCQQFPISQLLTINTHKGLFQLTRFGVHSVSGIFQRELENRLPSIPFVKVQLKVQVKIMVNILTI